MSTTHDLLSDRTTLQARVTALEADGRRLEWLEDNMTYIGGGKGGAYSFFSPADVEHGLLRVAIDAAMAPAQPEGEVRK